MIFDIKYDLDVSSLFTMNQIPSDKVIHDLTQHLSTIKVTLDIDEFGLISLMALNDKAILKNDTVYLKNGYIDLEEMIGIDEQS